MAALCFVVVLHAHHNWQQPRVDVVSGTDLSRCHHDPILYANCTLEQHKRRETQHEYIVGTLLSSVIISSSSQSQFTLTCTTAKFSSWLFLFLTHRAENTFRQKKEKTCEKPKSHVTIDKHQKSWNLSSWVSLSRERGKEDEIKHKKSLDCAAVLCEIVRCNPVKRSDHHRYTHPT